MAVMFRVVSEYSQGLWDFLLYILDWITEVAGVTEGLRILYID
jgi:hypothetical protein